MFDELKIAARFVIQSSCGLSQETHAAVVRQMPVRSGPWQGTRPMQCTWRSTSATVEDVEGGSWEGLEPANLVGESEWLESFWRCFLGPSVWNWLSWYHHSHPQVDATDRATFADARAGDDEGHTHLERCPWRCQANRLQVESCKQANLSGLGKICRHTKIKGSMTLCQN